MEKHDPTGFARALQDTQESTVKLDERRKKRLEGLPYIQQEFTQEELQQVVELNRLLQRVRSRLLAFNPEEVEEVHEYLIDVQVILDELLLWDTKFTTGDVGRPARQDSVYYTTRSGLALRFKQSHVVRDRGKIIQPFMENITFEDYSRPDVEEYPESMPAIGLYPQEYLSEEFYQAQLQSEVVASFTSSIKMYFEGQRLYYVQRPGHLLHEHNGSMINQVLFIR